MDIKRANDIVMAVQNGHDLKEFCKTQEEWDWAEDMKAEMAQNAEYGIGLDTIMDASE